MPSLYNPSNPPSHRNCPRHAPPPPPDSNFRSVPHHQSYAQQSSDDEEEASENVHKSTTLVPSSPHRSENYPSSSDREARGFGDTRQIFLQQRLRSKYCFIAKRRCAKKYDPTKEDFEMNYENF